jgi:small subunit ribosomal protein S16
VVKIRLQRRGRKKAPIYKLVAADARSPRDGKFIEALGQYAPVGPNATLVIDEERALYWLGVGAQPSDTARSLLSQAGVMLRFHLQRKGKSPEEIAQELDAWRKNNAAKAMTVSKKQLRAQRKAELDAKAAAEKAAAEKAAAEAAAKAEAEAAAKAAAEAEAAAAAEAAPAEEAAPEAPAATE